MPNEQNDITFQITVDNNTYDLGTDAEKVQINWTSGNETIQCTLQDFFENWMDFKENNTFIYYGAIDPTDNPAIKVWFDTEPAEPSV